VFCTRENTREGIAGVPGIRENEWLELVPVLIPSVIVHRKNPSDVGVLVYAVHTRWQQRTARGKRPSRTARQLYRYWYSSVATVLVLFWFRFIGDLAPQTQDEG